MLVQALTPLVLHVLLDNMQVTMITLIFQCHLSLCGPEKQYDL